MQPGGVHRVQHGGDDPGSEGRPGDIKSQFPRCNNLVEPEFFYQTMQVGGEAFIQRTCETNPITIIELKEKPECEKVEKVQLDNFHSHTLHHGEWKCHGLNSLLPLLFHKSGSVRKDVDPRGTILEGHQLPVSI